MEEQDVVDTESNPPNTNRKRESVLGKFGCKSPIII